MENAQIKKENVPENNSSPNNTVKNILKGIFWMIKEVAITIIVALLITNFIACRGVVIGHSMDDTLYDGENFIVDRLSYRLKEPDRFDIVIIEHPDLGYIVKRIIGLPGETVQIDENGNIYINGERLEENYGKETIQNAGNAANPITLGINQYFVLGDNRNNSCDSRFEAGLIEKDEIIGKKAF